MFDPNESYEASESKNEIKKGLLILLLDFVLIVLIVGVFDLNAIEPEWEDRFALVVLVMIPLYAFFVIGRAIWRKRKYS